MAAAEHPVRNANAIRRSLLRALPALPLLLAGTAPAAAQRRESVNFALQHTVPDSRWAVFVLGDLPELGEGDLPNAVKLRQVAPDRWSLDVSLPANREYAYRFYERRTEFQFIRDPGHGTAIGGLRTARTSPASISPSQRWILAHSDFDRPRLHWRMGTAAYRTVPMTDTGPGRTPGERRWLAYGVGDPLRPVEFYLTDEPGTRRDPPGGAYVSPLEALFLQDGHLFNYLPAAGVEAHRRDYDPENPPSMHSNELGETRAYRVLLPRGYDAHAQRRYPVVYLNDGQGQWDPHPLYGTVDPDGNVAAETIGTGRCGEYIAVAVDVPGIEFCEIARKRVTNYVPPPDRRNSFGCGEVAGEADRYVAFLVDELKPVIDATYRTLADPAHTFATGQSLGGLCSVFTGWDYSGVFGGIGSYSLARDDNFPARIATEPSPELRLYIDSGDDFWADSRDLRAMLVERDQRPFIIGRDVLYYYAAGQQHVPQDFVTRLPRMMSFLNPAAHAPGALPLPGDANCDEELNAFDIEPFILALVDPAEYARRHPGCESSDVNGDGAVSAFDIEPFLKLLVGS